MSCRALLFAVALCGTAISAVQAADQSVGAPVRAPSSYYPADSYYPRSIDWTGFYTGLQVGGGWAKAAYTDPISGFSNSPSAAAALGGAQVGANWQRDSLLFGVEADFVWMDVKGSRTDAAGDINTFTGQWLSTVTGRLGYAFNRWLVYGKGGFAFGSERDRITTTAATAAGPVGTIASTGMQTEYGWTAGAGVEYALDRTWSLRLEYDYIDLPSHGLFVTSTAPGFVPAPISANYTVQKLVGGINYRF